MMSERTESREYASSADREDPVAQVAHVLEDYASRGIFPGFRQIKRQGKSAEFAVRWHYRQLLSIRLDVTKSTLTLARCLPHVSEVPNLRRELGAYLRRFASQERPPHRRIDPGKTRVACYVRNDSLSLRFTVQDGDYEYATRRFVHLVNEIFLDFMQDAQYVEYMVAHMNMNPETGGSL